MMIKKSISSGVSSDWLFEDFSQEELLALDILSDISVAIQKGRKAKSLTQKDLAQKLQVSQGMISRWENGDENFTIETLAKIAIGLGLKLVNPLKTYTENTMRFDSQIFFKSNSTYRFQATNGEAKGVA